MKTPALGSPDLLAQQTPFDVLILWVIILGIFFFLVIWPQQRRHKKTQEMQTGLKNGDKVVTSSGIYGTVAGIEGDTIHLRIADQVKIKMVRTAVAAFQPESKEGS